LAYPLQRRFVIIIEAVVLRGRLCGGPNPLPLPLLGPCGKTFAKTELFLAAVLVTIIIVVIIMELEGSRDIFVVTTSWFNVCRHNSLPCDKILGLPTRPQRLRRRNLGALRETVFLLQHEHNVLRKMINSYPKTK
jgi:hypothetical protein